MAVLIMLVVAVGRLPFDCVVCGSLRVLPQVTLCIWPALGNSIHSPGHSSHLALKKALSLLHPFVIKS